MRSKSKREEEEDQKTVAVMTMEVVKKTEEEYAIKPQAATPALDTSSWPLLLKNYDKRTSQLMSEGGMLGWDCSIGG